MTTKTGRPPLHGINMVKRTYQITEEQDQAIKKLAKELYASQSHVIRLAINRSAKYWDKV